LNTIKICGGREMATDKSEIVKELMTKPENIRNIGIAAHIDHGKTTLTDSLVAGAGMMSEELAGKQLFTDFDEQEQERGITIYSANVSMVHEFENDNYLINLIDTPGHVDFGGDVTRAMRAVDGAIIVACAVEGVMPQTETVIRQALKERVKPVLFINKVDRLIKELKLTPEAIQERFMKIIKEVNILIQKYAEKKYRNWLVKVEDGSVAFGSAYRKWAISIPFMQENKITFKDIIDKCSTDKDEELTKATPLHRILLNMVIKHLPDPVTAQEYRIPKIWKGDINSDIGKAMQKVDPKAPLAAVVTKVITDPHAGLVATARIFSGTIKRGEEVHLINQHASRRIQQISIYKGPQRIQMKQIPAGNIIGIVGLPDAFSGETIAEKEIQPFESIQHIFEPVVTKSIEPENPNDLPKIIEFLKQIRREDPTLEVNINEETGEYLVSGLGELHIDAKVERPLKEKGFEIKASIPIVVYRETVRQESKEVEGKSSNKHNRFYLTVEPLDQSIYSALAEDKIDVSNVKKRRKDLIKELQEYDLPKQEAKGIKDIYNRNLLIDMTKGIQHLSETFEMIIDAFRRMMNHGPVAGEPCSGIKVKVHDAKLHEDAIHRGPAQVLPAIRQALQEAIFDAKPTLLEPLQTIRIDVPEDAMGDAMSQVQNRRGQIIDTSVELGTAVIKASIPVAEMFGFEAALKSATGGKGFYSLIEVFFKPIPEDLREPTVKKIRQRKGMDVKTEDE
jgi:elongation factor 2